MIAAVAVTAAAAVTVGAVALTVAGATPRPPGPLATGVPVA